MRIGSSVPGLLLVIELDVWKYDDRWRALPASL
jgi:hypothetical protein